MARHYLGGVSDWLKQIVSQSEALMGSDTSSLWNFCIRFSDAISWGNHSGGVAKCRLLSQAWGLVGCCANIVLGCTVDNMLVLLILVTMKPSVGEEILLNSKIVFSTNKSFSLPVADWLKRVALKISWMKLKRVLWPQGIAS